MGRAIMAAQRDDRPRAWVLLLLALTGCGGCDEGTPVRASPSGTTSAVMPLPEPWVMGAASGDAALPPPCQAREDPLTVVLGRQSRIASEPHTLGRVLVAEGATHAVGGTRPAHPALALKRWSADASGLMTMRHGPTRVDALPWPSEQPPQLARAADGKERWLALMDREDDSWLWRDGRLERLGDARALAPASLSCERSWCALLTAPVDATSTPTGASGASLWLGRASEPVQSWHRVNLHAEGARPFGVTGVRVGDDGVTAYATMADDLRARVIAVRGETSRAVASPLAPHGLMDTTLAGEPVVVAFAGPRGPRRCDAAGGGVLVSIGDGEAVQLRSALPAERGHAHAIDGGVLVTWLAPARCDGPRRVLHAAVVRDDGRPAAPVTVVGEAEDYAVATSGADVDLWLRRSGGITGPSDMGTVLYLRARCDLR